jgi:cell division protein FtsW
VGLNLQGSRSWINLGFTTFQPAELAKIALIIIGSYLLADSKRDWRDWQSQLLPVLAVIGLPVALVLLQGDLGTGTIMIVIVAFLLVMGKIPTRYLMTIGLIGLVLVTILIAVKETRRQRIEVFWNPDNHTQDDIGSQIYQSKIAVGSGGFWGLGYGKSRQKFSYLPEVNSDSVFPIIGEELGFVGAVFLITLVILICWRGLRIGTRAPDQFGQFLVAGIIVWIGWQTFLNIGGIIGALPLTGVPLPLVSHGGSAYMMTLAGLGIVVSVSRQSKLP